MAPGERAALSGVVQLLQPSLSIEIGTAEGGSLGMVSLASEEVHSFDLQRHSSLTSERFPNVVFHTGDSHELLPKVLDELSKSGQNVDFALVDGDHSAEGVQTDVESLLRSPSVGLSAILVHDTLNHRVRQGLENVDYQAFDKIRFVDLDFVPGRVMREGPVKDEYWSGLGLIVTGGGLDLHQPWSAYAVPHVYEGFSTALAAAGENSDPLSLGRISELEQELAVQRDILELIESSWSWRLTAPLRAAKRLARRAGVRR